jgi:uncharacterized protein (TIGR03435 family)
MECVLPGTGNVQTVVEVFLTRARQFSCHNSGVKSDMRWLVCALLVLTAARGAAQPPTRAAFDSATIKLNATCGNARGGGPSPGQLNLTCRSMRNLIQAAYGSRSPQPPQVLGGPAWLDSERYDLNAKTNDGAPLDQILGPMLQAFLEERCGVMVHRESREIPVYSLTVIKDSAQRQRTKEGSCIPIDIHHLPAQPAPGEAAPNLCGRAAITGFTVDWFGTSMPEFAARMFNLDRPVVDKTGLTGLFDLHLESVPRGAIAGIMARGVRDTPDAADPSVFDSVLDQIGLKLAADRGSVEFILVDSAAKPSGK